MNETPPPFRVLIDRETIHRRVVELAHAVAERHPDLGALCVVSVIEGARTFCRALVDQLPDRPPVHQIRASSYHASTVSSGVVDVRERRPIPCSGRTVLIVEDIVDTGRTVARLKAHFAAAGAVAVEVVTLLTKPSRREVEVAVDWVGFEVEDRFLVGYGMDFAGRYRELPDIVVHEPAVEDAHRA